MDCFFIGRLSGTKGSVWQDTAIDAHSSFPWAGLHASARNPSARSTSALADRVAEAPAQRGWRKQAVCTDNGSEFTSRGLGSAVAGLGAQHRRIHARRAQSNGFVERAQLTVLDECWRPAFARHLIPKLTGRRPRWIASWWTTTPTAPTMGASPKAAPRKVLGKARMWRPRRS